MSGSAANPKQPAPRVLAGGTPSRWRSRRSRYDPDNRLRIDTVTVNSGTAHTLVWDGYGDVDTSWDGSTYDRYPDGSEMTIREFWSTWLDSGSCDDGSVVLNYNGTCFRTSNLCQAPEGQPGWSDDPAIGDVADCCGGLTAEEQELLDPAPMCSG